MGKSFTRLQKEMKKQAREMQSGQIQFGPWENRGVSPLETYFWACGGEEGYWKKPACVFQGWIISDQRDCLQIFLYPS